VKLLRNFLLSAIALMTTLCLLELVVFRYVFVPSDLPRLAVNDSGVLKFMPNQTGTYRIRDEIDAPFHVNSNGWNSRNSTYNREKDTNKPRICIVGDSYIEALQVRYNSSIAERLEDYLDGAVDSVYRFGLSGAPLSQYLYMIEEEVLTFRPDYIIVNLVPNDFLESIENGGGTYWSSFSRLEVTQEGAVLIRSPEIYAKPMTWWIKQSAMFRYFWVRYQVRPPGLKQLWRKIFDADTEKPVYVGNINVDAATDLRIPVIVDYVFARFAELSKEQRVKFILLMDADRSLIGRDSVDLNRRVESRLAPLYALVRKIAKRHEIDFIDLTNVFVEDFERYEVPIEFPHDGHWNAYAHRLAGETLGEFLHSTYLMEDMLDIPMKVRRN